MAMYVLGMLKFISLPAGTISIPSGYGDLPVAHDHVWAIRAFRWAVALYDHERNQVLRTRVDLTRRQLLAPAGEQGVPVYDYRAWWGCGNCVTVSGWMLVSRRSLARAGLNRGGGGLHFFTP